MLLSAEWDLVTRDSAVPGLATLLDEARFLDTLSHHAPQLGARSARLDYVRYKPGQNCLGAYAVETVLGLKRFHAKAIRGDDVRKQARVAERGVEGGRIVVPERAMEICPFPLDNKLPHLALLQEEDWRRQFLSRHLPERQSWHAGSVRTLAYKPERRWVGAIEIGGVPLGVCKLYGETDFNRLLNCSSGFQEGEVLRLAPLMGKARYRRALFLGWCEGELLSQAWVKPDFDHSLLAQVGVALGELQQQTPPGLGVLDTGSMCAALNELGRSVAFVLPHLKDRVLGVVGQITERLQELPSCAQTVHGDFYAKQVLLQGRRVVLLDLDEAALGHPESDVGGFLAHLEREVVAGRIVAAKRDRFRSAFLEGYLRAVSNCRLETVELHVAAKMVQRLPQFFRTHTPDWPARTEHLLTRVEACLDSPIQRRRPRPAVRLELPSLARALNPASAAPLLAEALQAFNPAVRLHSLRSAHLRRCKPGRRALIEYDADCEVGGGGVETWSILGKVRSRGVSTSNWAAVCELYRQFPQDSVTGISIPKPLGVVEELAMWLQHKVSAPSLAEAITGPDGAAAASRVADAIVGLHQSVIPLSRQHTITDELAILERRLSALAESRPEWRERLDRLQAYCMRLGRRLPSVSVRPIHRDFYQDQVLLASDRIWLVDLDLLCAGDPALDAGNFVGHLMEWGVRSPALVPFLRPAWESFSERFLALTPDVTRETLESYTTLTLARHVSISSQLPGRRGFTGALLDLCETRCGLGGAATVGCTFTTSRS